MRRSMMRETGLFGRLGKYMVCVCVALGSEAASGQSLGPNPAWYDSFPAVPGRRWPVGQALPLMDRPSCIAVNGAPVRAFVSGSATLVNGGKSIATVAYKADDPNDVIEAFWPPVVQPGEQFIPVACVILDQAAFGGEQGAPILFITGHVPGDSGTRDTVTLAYTQTLQLIWQRTFTHNDPSTEFLGDDIPVAISATRDWVAVAVTSRGASTGNDIQLLLYDALTGRPRGNPLLMRHTSAGNYDDAAVGVHVSGIGDQATVIISGTLAGQAGTKAVAAWRTLAGSPSVIVDTRQTPAGVYQFDGRAMAQTGAVTSAYGFDTETWITGLYRLNDQLAADAFVLKFDWTLNPNEWIETFDGGTPPGTAVWDECRVIAARSFGPEPGRQTYIAAGGFSTTGPGGLKRALTLLYHDQGTVHDFRWASHPQSEDGSTLDEEVLGVAIGNPSPDVRVYATAAKSHDGQYDYWTAAYDEVFSQPRKQALPEPLFLGTNFGNDFPAAIAYQIVLGQGGIYVTGRSPLPQSGEDYLSMRYNVPPNP